MQMQNYSRGVSSAAQKLSFFSILAIISIGCGKADYESAMRSRASNLQLGSGFLENLFMEPHEVLGGAVSLQLPTYLNEDAKVLKSGQRTRLGTPLSNDRILPPGVEIPGFEFTYELWLIMEGIANKQPMYWYFGSAPADANLKSIEAKLRTEAARLVPKSSPRFADVQIAKPDGSTLPYRKLAVRGTQRFAADPDTEDFEDKPGEFRIYIHTSGGRHVIIGLRGTDEAIQQLDAMTRAEYALGTVSVNGGGES